MRTLETIVKKRLLLAGVMVAAVALVGAKVYADDASDIEQFYPGAGNANVTYDNTGGVAPGTDPSGYPVITAIQEAPIVIPGKTYTGWSVLAQDATGSLDLFITQAALTTLTHNASATLTVGMGISANAQFDPFHQEPELAFSTVPASNNSVIVQSTGNALPATNSYTIGQFNTAGALNNTAISNNIAVAGTLIEIQNATISGSTGSFMSTFPTVAQANTVSETYTITDNTGSMTMFDFATSDSANGLLGGTAVPTGPVNIFGVDTVFPSAGLPGGGLPEFIPIAFQAVPEPSTVMLVGAGLFGLLAIRRRRS